MVFDVEQTFNCSWYDRVKVELLGTAIHGSMIEEAQIFGKTILRNLVFFVLNNT